MFYGVWKMTVVSHSAKRLEDTLMSCPLLKPLMWGALKPMGFELHTA